MQLEDGTTTTALLATYVDDILAAQEFYHSRQWTDGLPVVQPTANAVQACLDWAMMPADHLVGI